MSEQVVTMNTFRIRPAHEKSEKRGTQYCAHPGQVDSFACWISLQDGHQFFERMSPFALFLCTLDPFVLFLCTLDPFVLFLCTLDPFVLFLCTLDPFVLFLCTLDEAYGDHLKCVEIRTSNFYELVLTGTEHCRMPLLRWRSSLHRTRVYCHAVAPSTPIGSLG